MVLKLAADQGYAGAQNNLGEIYYYGDGVLPDDNKAVRLFKLAADQGHAEALYNLGVMYAKGQGVVQNYKKAFKCTSWRQTRDMLGRSLVLV